MDKVVFRTSTFRQSPGCTTPVPDRTMTGVMLALIRLATLSVFLAVPIVAGAQASTGSVAGKIGDTSGAPLPGVTVTATFDGRTQSVTTNSRGEYRLDGLAPGVYRLWASSPGFVTSTADRTIVEARRVTEWNVPMIAALRDAQQGLLIAMRAYVERFTGPQAVDCGQHLLPRPLAPIDAETMRRSLACGTEAMRRGKPFWTFWQQQGIDSWVAVGLLGTADGAFYRFDYDSAPCGGAGCGDRFSIEPCSTPRIRMDRSDAVLTCRLS